MQVAEVMTRRVITVNEHARLAEAVGLMLRHGISGLPVTGASGGLVGILTEGDLLRRAETGTARRRPRWIEFLLGPARIAEEYVRSHALTVAEVMSTNVVTVAPDTSLERVVELMEKKRIRRLPVLEAGYLVGIVTRANLMQALMSVAHDLPAGPVSDEQIRAQLWAELERKPWALPGMVTIFVRDGVVNLRGAVADPRERDALRVAAENIPGVRSVRDDLVWCDYLSGAAVELDGRRGNGMQGRAH